MYSDRGRRYEFKVEHGHGEEFQTKNYIKFFIKEEEMKGFTPEMLWQQLKEKCNSANISNIKYMDMTKIGSTSDIRILSHLSTWFNQPK